MTAQTSLTTARSESVQEERCLLCWSCRSSLGPVAKAVETASIPCTHCGNVTHCKNGIWRCLSPDEIRAYEQFANEYECVRAAEGRGSLYSAYYLALPYEDLSGKMAQQWKIRACTYDHQLREVIQPRAVRWGRPLRILDVGAGNGWLSYRLALLGHSPVAVDLLVNDQDGLGAAKHFAAHLPKLFLRVQATADRLPFPSGVFDLAIFNASFHYSKDYAQTLAEAIRCLRPGGTVVIADTPWYACHESGEKMVDEKRAYFRSTYGFESSSIASQEFLTPQRLNELANLFNLKWQVIKPFYGVNWALRPLKAKLKRRRTPSHFHIHVAEVAA